MNWKNEINEIFDLATLHSWCNQVNELLDIFNNKYQVNSDIVKYLIKTLKEKNLPSEHYIISIVLLKYQSYPTEDIIELAISSLYSKINKNDIQFFKEHLFSGSFPLSSDLSEDITNRSFLSPKFAIKKAMQIDSVISKNNPIITVLYMNFILSRMDMNEENRAMVAFLLLRVDIDLPISLKERVYKYLLEYKDIIKELLEEEMGESVIIEDISGIKEKITKIQIIEKEYLPAENVKIKNIKSENILRKITKKDSEIVSDFSTNKLKIINQNTIISQNKHTKIKSDANSILEDTIVNEKATNSKKSKSNKTQPDKENNVKIIDITKKKNSKIRKIKGKITKSKIIPFINPGKQKENIFKGDDSIDLKSKFKNNENIKKSIKKKEDLKSVNKSWNIGLKENKSILESILAGVENIKLTNIFLNKKIKKDDNVSNKFSSIFKKRRTKYYLFLSAIILLIIFLILGDKKIEKTILISDLDTSSNNLINQITNESKSIGDQQETINTDGIEITETSKLTIPENFPINIKIENNQIVWKVLEGESITGLFFALKDFNLKLKNTKLEQLSKMNWDDFFERFKNNNPARNSYHIIFPGEEFILPLE